MPYTSFGQAEKIFYKSVFLSDFHIGAKSFDAKALLSFLKNMDCEKLYLVGDIIDGWKLNKRWYWTEDCNQVFDALIRKRNAGTQIIYLPGNHDEEIRRFNLLSRHDFARKLKITVKDKIIHKMSDGRRFLIMHGDQFDHAILKGPLSKWSDRLYDILMDFFQAHQSPPQIEVNGKMKRFSLSKSLSKHGQWALYLLNNFESTIYKQAQKYAVDGLICGHTHIPALKNIKDITYANCGSWLRSGHTALVEDENGILKLVDCPASQDPAPLFHAHFLNKTEDIVVSSPVNKERATTEKLIALIRAIWPEEEKQSLPQPQEWIEIHGRDRVTLNKAVTQSHHFVMPHGAPNHPATAKP